MVNLIACTLGVLGPYIYSPLEIHDNAGFTCGIGWVCRVLTVSDSVVYKL
jgi:hypothetical protein